SGGTNLRVGVVTTTGNVRESNEDNYYVPGRASLRDGKSISGEFKAAGLEPPVTNGPPGLFIVADGMGGQQAGDKASQIAVAKTPVELARLLPANGDDRAIQHAVRDAVAEANKEILALASVEIAYANMGTTVVLVLFRNGRAFVSGIGDSRAYRLRDG